MLSLYLAGSVAQLQLRAQRLVGRIPRDLPREYAALEQACRLQINAIIAGLNRLAEDEKNSNPKRQTARLRVFRRLVADLDILEATGIMALTRRHSDDHLLNHLIEQIRKEIRYPLAAPVVSSLSQQYFQIKSDLNLLFVPLAEADFLLHLPDLYHELAHPLLSVVNDPALDPFQNSFYRAADHVMCHLDGLERREDRRYGPKAYAILLKQWADAWIPFWLTELFCDAFATCTLGPAYAWAHLHLIVKRGDNPFEIWNSARSHPPDEARLRVMLACLEQCGMGPAAGRVRTQWNGFRSETELEAEPEYQRCLPDNLLTAIATEAKAGIEGLGCSLADSNQNQEVSQLLNAAWEQFWTAPESYVDWERTEIEKLRQQSRNGR